MVGFAVCFLFLEILKETFTAGIIKRKALFRKGLHNVQRIQKLSESKSSILTSPVVSINMQDQRSNVLILLYTGSRGGGEMLIVSTSVNLQNPAKRFYAMLEPKLMNSI